MAFGFKPIGNMAGGAYNGPLLKCAVGGGIATDVFTSFPLIRSITSLTFVGETLICLLLGALTIALIERQGSKSKLKKSE